MASTPLPLLLALFALAPASAFTAGSRGITRALRTRIVSRPHLAMAEEAVADSPAPAPAATRKGSVVVGGGRIGAMLKQLDPDAVMCGRGDAIPADMKGPIYVATRNDALDDIIDRTPEDRREDLVFLQNGYLSSYLGEKGLADNTVGLIYFAVAKLGDKPLDGITDANPEGLTSVTGKWAKEFSALMQKGDLTCHVMEPEPFVSRMLEKHIWICAFMLVGQLHGGITVGEVEKEHKEQVLSLIEDLCVACFLTQDAVQFGKGVEERLCAYARSVAHFPTALKEFQWRNGFFHGLSEKAKAEEMPDPCPVHTRMLQQCVDEGLFTMP